MARKAKASLLNRKRGIDPRITQVSYLAGLREARIKRIRKTDRAGFDAYHADLFSRLFPAK